jgi:hypothetical protein
MTTAAVNASAVLLGTASAVLDLASEMTGGRFLWGSAGIYIDDRWLSMASALSKSQELRRAAKRSSYKHYANQRELFACRIRFPRRAFGKFVEPALLVSSRLSTVSFA